MGDFIRAGKATSRSRRWRWALLMGGVVLTVGWLAVSKDDSPVVEDNPASPPLAEEAASIASALPAAVPEIETPDVGLAISPERDVGTAHQLLPDAGMDPFRIELIMKRWREALAPLFKPDRKSAGTPAPIIVLQGDGDTEAFDAGTAVPCGENVEQFSIRSSDAIDIVVAIDTSGSMFGELPRVVGWLSALEHRQRTRGADFQMIVVADHAMLGRRSRRGRADGGERDGGRVQAPIGSRDALETLIASAHEGPSPRWSELLRPHSTKHLVIVSDDEASDATGTSYLEPLVAAGGGLLGTVAKPAFALHFLGGFEPPNGDTSMAFDEPLALGTCRGGVAPGLAYQRLAQATHGLRASLCYARALVGFPNELFKFPRFGLASQCMWLMRSGIDARDITQVRAVGKRLSLRLWEANSAASCSGRGDRFLTSGQAFVLCADTCASLTDAGYERVTISTRCRQ